MFFYLHFIIIFFFKEPIERILASTSPNDSIICYICQTSDVPGKFDSKKANELGVPNGPLRGKLTKGESIKIPNTDRIVHPQDVIGINFYSISFIFYLISSYFLFYMFFKQTKKDHPKLELFSLLFTVPPLTISILLWKIKNWKTITLTLPKTLLSLYI